MTVGAISSNALSIFQSSQPNGTSQTQSTSFSGPGQSSGVQSGGLLDSVALALQQIGATGQTGSASISSGDSSDSASTQDPAQALSSFMHSLIAALHAQNTSASGAADGSNGSQSSASVSGVSRGGGHHHHSHMKADVDSLLQQLSSSGDGSTSSTSSTDASGSTATDLEQSFQNLMNSLGQPQSGSTENLNQFLKALSGNVQDLGPAGNVVSTQV